MKAENDKSWKKSLKNILVETERGFKFANQDFYKVSGKEDLWYVIEIDYNHVDATLPENKGKARVKWKTKDENGNHEVTWEPFANCVEFYKSDS